MSSPDVTGGPGIHLENSLVAEYLVATLTGGAVLGWPPGAVATEAQRAFEDAPLDDMISSVTSAPNVATLPPK